MPNFIGLLFGKNKKNKKMENKEVNLEELNSMYSNMEFQWIKGDDNLSVELFKRVNKVGESIFVEFESGKRINLELLEEYMTYFPAQPKLKQIDHRESGIIKTTPQPKTSSVTEVVYKDSQLFVDTDSPIYKLLKKQKENIVEVSIKLKLNLPPKELYGVLSSSFDDADSEIINFVLDGIDIEDIKSSLADSIKKTYYSVNKKVESEKNLVLEKSTIGKNSKNNE